MSQKTFKYVFDKGNIKPSSERLNALICFSESLNENNEGKYNVFVYRFSSYFFTDKLTLVIAQTKIVTLHVKRGLMDFTKKNVHFFHGHGA